MPPWHTILSLGFYITLWERGEVVEAAPLNVALLISRAVAYVLPSYVITERRNSLELDLGDSLLCITLGEKGPAVRRGECGSRYLVVEPYRGVFLGSSPLKPAEAASARFIDFYLVSGFGIAKYRLVESGGKMSLRRSHEVELFNGFVKIGEYKELEKAFENWVRAYSASCIFGCAASLGIAADLEAVEELVRGARRVGEIFYRSGLAIYVEPHSRNSVVVEAVAAVSAVDEFRAFLMAVLEASNGLHWAYMGRLLRSRPSTYIDLFLPRLGAAGLPKHH